VNKTPEYPRSRLELESLSWHVGGVEAVSSTLDGLWDQAGVFINLNEKTRQPGVNITQATGQEIKPPWVSIASLNNIQHYASQMPPFKRGTREHVFKAEEYW